MGDLISLKMKGLVKVFAPALTFAKDNLAEIPIHFDKTETREIR